MSSGINRLIGLHKFHDLHTFAVKMTRDNSWAVLKKCYAEYKVNISLIKFNLKLQMSQKLAAIMSGVHK